MGIATLTAKPIHGYMGPLGETSKPSLPSWRAVAGTADSGHEGAARTTMFAYHGPMCVHVRVASISIPSLPLTSYPGVGQGR